MKIILTKHFLDISAGAFSSKDITYQYLYVVNVITGCMEEANITSLLG